MKHVIRRSKSEWETIVRDQAASGLGVKKFCESESISVSSFHRWRGRLSDGLSRSGNIAMDPLFIDMGSVDDLGAAGTDGEAVSLSSNVFEVTLDLGLGVKLTLRRS